jgi:hypothetical protein
MVGVPEVSFMGRKKKRLPELIAGWKFRNVTLSLYGNGHVSPRLWVSIGSCLPVLWHRGEVAFVFDRTDDDTLRWSVCVSPTPGDGLTTWSLLSLGSEDEFLFGLFEYCYGSRLPARDIVCDLIGTIADADRPPFGGA